MEGSEARTMAEILPAKISLPGCQRPGTFETFHAEALFASTLQPSGPPSSEQVRRVIVTTLRRLGTGGCAARRVAEFGDHPDTAVASLPARGHSFSRADRGATG
jgi:hypothetical protein